MLASDFYNRHTKVGGSVMVCIRPVEKSPVKDQTNKQYTTHQTKNKKVFTLRCRILRFAAFLVCGIIREPACAAVVRQKSRMSINNDP